MHSEPLLVSLRENLSPSEMDALIRQDYNLGATLLPIQSVGVQGLFVFIA